MVDDDELTERLRALGVVRRVEVDPFTARRLVREARLLAAVASCPYCGAPLDGDVPEQ